MVVMKICVSVQESWIVLLTGWDGGAYIRLNNEGGAPLAGREFVSAKAFLEVIQESRLGDTRRGPEPKAKVPFDTVYAVSVL